MGEKLQWSAAAQVNGVVLAFGLHIKKRVKKKSGMAGVKLTQQIVWNSQQSNFPRDVWPRPGASQAKCHLSELWQWS